MNDLSCTVTNKSEARIPQSLTAFTLKLTLVLASILAPRSSRSLTIFAFPLFDATCKGVISFCGRKNHVSLSFFHELPDQFAPRINYA